MDYSTLEHIPVLYEETLEALSPQPGDKVLDCTLGGAGHASAFLERIGPDGFLWGIEQDPMARAKCKEKLKPFEGQYQILAANFAELPQLIQSHNLPQMDIIFADLGTSMFQLKAAERGFSFMLDGPLDMRMNPEQEPSAADLVNLWPEEELTRIFKDYGEERYAKPIARAIVKERQITPFKTTQQLAEFISKLSRGRQKIHPATRVFQALRIEVNQELKVLDDFLPQAIDLLKPGGRLGIISFHSLEDRRVKKSLQKFAKDCLCPPKQPVCTCDHKALIQIAHRKGWTASAQEVKKNSASRSARLRSAQKM